MLPSRTAKRQPWRLATGLLATALGCTRGEIGSGPGVTRDAAPEEPWNYVLDGAPAPVDAAPQPDAPACAVGELLCGGSCIDPQTDRDHCGGTADCSGASAGVACASGVPCSSGSCQPLASCLDVLEAGLSTGGGIYWLDPDGSGGSASYQAYCDMSTDGGGWTLALKADGTRTTFAHGAAAWTDFSVLNANAPDLDQTEAKLRSFNTVPFTQVLLQLSTGTTKTSLVVSASAASLRALFAAGTFVDIPSTTVTRATWMALIPGSALQSNCNRAGFNNAPGTSNHKVRLGILGNNEGDCNTPDSHIGIGATGNACNTANPAASVGNAAGCNGDNGTTNIASFGVLFVR
jgi:hypothetical protein